jgi:hypothetical protein
MIRALIRASYRPSAGPSRCAVCEHRQRRR